MFNHNDHHTNFFVFYWFLNCNQKNPNNYKFLVKKLAIFSPYYYTLYVGNNVQTLKARGMVQGLKSWIINHLWVC